tara:strand:- start:483 stop:626 length:144 start_codon:yes stop_codon:yes gene_type:complete
MDNKGQSKDSLFSSDFNKNINSDDYEYLFQRLKSIKKIITILEKNIK